MSAVHAVAGLAVLLAFAAVVLVAVGVAALDRGHVWVGRAVAIALVAAAAQVALGGVTWLLGGRPAEGIHLLYGLAVLGVLPLAGSFADEAPPRARAWVVAVAATIGLVLVWRLYLTG